MARIPLRFVRFFAPARHSDDHMRTAILREAPAMRAGTTAPAIIRWSGFDVEDRLLWDIPEVIATCRTVVRTGYLALLHLNLPPRRTLRGWGAIDVYLCANENLAEFDPLGSRRSDDGFGRCLEAAEAQVDALLARAGEIQPPVVR